MRCPQYSTKNKPKLAKGPWPMGVSTAQRTSGAPPHRQKTQAALTVIPAGGRYYSAICMQNPSTVTRIHRRTDASPLYWPATSCSVSEKSTDCTSGSVAQGNDAMQEVKIAPNTKPLKLLPAKSNNW